MKQLICLATIQELLVEKKGECLISPEAIITPAAKDLADEEGIIFVTSEVAAILPEDISLVMEQLCSNRGLLQQLISILETPPFKSTRDESGFQLIHGETVRYEENEKKPGMLRQTLFENFNQLTIDLVKLAKGTSEQTCAAEAIYIVLAGRMITVINQKQFESQKGDIQYYPAHIERIIKAKEETQLLVISRN